MPLHQALADHRNTRPQAPAIALAGRVLDYATLYERVQLLDAWVAQLPKRQRDHEGLREAPVLALHMGNEAQAIDCIVAALAGHFCIMLIDPLLPIEQVRNILRKLPADALFTTEPLEGFNGLDTPCYQLAHAADLDALIERAPEAQPPAPTADSPFLIGFTSGTTSQPKAFVRDRASWQRSLARGHDHFSMHAAMDTLSPGPLTHGLSLYALAETLYAGACFHTVEKFGKASTVAALQGGDIKRLVCVPSLLQAVLRDQPSASTLATLTQITTAGAKLEAGLLCRVQTAAPTAKITEYYGASELGFVTTRDHPCATAPDQSSATLVGQAFPGIQIEIRPIDAAPTRSGKQHASGQIWVRSDLAIEAYLWQEGSSAFQTKGDWSTVGDLGHIDAQGNLHLVGRAGGMITSGGNNIYPEEVASWLKTHANIAECSVLGLPDPQLGSALVAILQWHDPMRALKANALLDFCHSGLQKYKIPHQFWHVNSWPLTSSGKIATSELRNWIDAKDSRLEPI